MTPKKAYAFIKGRAAPVGGDTLEFSPGGHEITTHSHGYEHDTRRVKIEAGKITALDVSLKPVSGTVSGPSGRIPIQGRGCTPGLVNGQLPGDELNNDIIWMQEVLVLQESLRNQGYYSGPIDGALGSADPSCYSPVSGVSESARHWPS